MIRAVVFDIGGVLERLDDRIFPGPWCERHGIARDLLEAAFAAMPGDAAVGALTEDQMRGHLIDELGLSRQQSDELWSDLWRWYVGELDRPLVDWFAGVRARGLKAAILSNSGPGAREQERPWGFEDMVDVLIYSHEVGLKKPDPAIYDLTARELGVRPGEIVLVDDWPDAVDGARAAGWRTVHHRGDAPDTIAQLERLLSSP